MGITEQPNWRRVARRIWLWTLDFTWLLALTIYAFAGMSITPFQDDESAHIFTSADYFTLFVHSHPEALLTYPPYPSHDAGRLRLVSASVPRYAIGLTLAINGLTEADLPQHTWWLNKSYEQNIAAMARPSDTVLDLGRIQSTLFFAMSSALIFVASRLAGKRWLAYMVSGSYGLNPVVLYNGRHAAMEGSMLFFGLLAVLLTLVIIVKQERGWQIHWGWWTGLVLVCSLVIASKHTGVLYTGAAFLSIFIAQLIHRRPAELVKTSLVLIVGGLAVIGLSILFLPALWSDPIARTKDSVQQHYNTISAMIAHRGGETVPLPDRFLGLIVQPFMTPVTLDSPDYWLPTPVGDEIRRYEASYLAGIDFGPVIGGFLTLCMGLGLITLLWPRIRPYRSWGITVGIAIFGLVTAASQIADPVPWQRYYLPWMSIAIPLSGLGLAGLVELTRQQATRLKWIATSRSSQPTR